MRFVLCGTPMENVTLARSSQSTGQEYMNLDLWEVHG